LSDTWSKFDELLGAMAPGASSSIPMSRIGGWPLYPFLAAAYPVLALWASNVGQLVPVGDVLASLVVALTGTGVLLLLIRLLVRQTARAALIATVVVTLFFSYGYAWNGIQSVFPSELANHAVLIASWVAIAIVSAGVLVRWPRAPALTAPLNVAGTILLAMSLAPLGLHAASLPTAAPPDQDPVASPAVSHTTRDIYWIIMDRYGSASVLEEAYGFDNRPFLDALRDRGFYIAEDATANYLKTALSLESSRDMAYADTDALRGEATSNNDWGPVHDRLDDSFEVQRQLSARGYAFAYLGSYWAPTGSNAAADLNLRFAGAGSEFQSALADTTALRALSGPLDPRRTLWEITRFQFNALERAAALDGPTFVHAHIGLPHDPFVFRADGSYQPEEETFDRTFEEMFVDQVRYANTELLRIVDHLRDVPDEEQPIIVIQADEGPFPRRYREESPSFVWPEATDAELREKFGILNAFHLPGIDAEDAGLYPSISSVNTFRVILRAYHGMDLPLLPDRNLVFAAPGNNYELVDLTSRVRAAMEAGP
jgi:hypothetical protein